MIFEQTYLEGCFCIQPKLFNDSRGSFFENYNQKIFNAQTKTTTHFVQDNQSISHKGVLRGLHFQTGKNAQAKLVRVVQGAVLDIAVDLRPNSKTFGQHVSILLDNKNNKQLFIPRGFAHGFLTLADNTIFSYKCDNFYDKKAESGIIYNDCTLNIDWKFPEDQLILSDKDKELPTFETLFR